MHKFYENIYLILSIMYKYSAVLRKLCASKLISGYFPPSFLNLEGDICRNLLNARLNWEKLLNPL